MVGRSTSSPFKFVFWGILLIVLLTTFGPLLYLLGHESLIAMRGFPPFMPFHTSRFIMTFPFLLLLGIYVWAVGTWVFRDATRRGMDPWLWATIAVFVPFFIGLIIYLVARTDPQIVACAKCGRPLRQDFRVCPYCGLSLDRVCTQCGTHLAGDWKVCPQCGLSATPSARTRADTGAEDPVL